MAEEIEKIRIKGKSVRNLLNKDLVKSLEDKGFDWDFIGLQLFSRDEKGLGSITHENSEEIDEKIIHIEGDTPKLVENIKEVIKNCD